MEYGSYTAATKIGVFDSGLGGLTVLKELVKDHPERDYIYFGDTAHVPYGSRQADDVITLVKGIARFLVAEGCQGLILACNTSSALALSALREEIEVPIMGVIEAAAGSASHGNRVAVLANPLTAASGVYGRKIEAIANGDGRSTVEVLEIACPELVDIVEGEKLGEESSHRVLQSYADRVKTFGADTLVLGCTHYPLLLPVLESMLGEDVRIVNPAKLIPALLPSVNRTGSAEVRYCVSGSAEEFDSAASKIMGQAVSSQQCNLTSESALS